MSCDVPMTTFEGAPFNLDSGNSILVRASAFVDNGWGVPSEVSLNGARVL